MSLKPYPRLGIVLALVVALAVGLLALLSFQNPPMKRDLGRSAMVRQYLTEMVSTFFQPIDNTHGLSLQELLEAQAPPLEGVRLDMLDPQGRIAAAKETGLTVEQSVKGVRWVALEQPVPVADPCLKCHTNDAVAAGTLRMAVPDPLRPRLSPFLWAGLHVVLMLVAGLVFALWFHYLWARPPIRDLAQKMAQVAAGDFNVRINRSYSKDMSHLADHFNTMVSALQELEQEVRQSHFRQMERMDRLASVGEMAAGIAHEIRNPLAGIGGAITVMAEDLPSGDERYPILQEVLQQIRRLDKTVTDLLYYARPGKPELRKCDINELVSKTLFFVSQHPEARNVHRSEELTRGLPLLEADSTQLQQILLNLLLNAIQAMPQGGTLRVSTGTSYCGVQVRISDSGPGIPQEVRERIFHPFFTTKAQGTGLGLSICRRLVEQQGGTIQVADTPGGGTTMILDMPLEAIIPEEKDE